jgi:hypothetical protein
LPWAAATIVVGATLGISVALWRDEPAPPPPTTTPVALPPQPKPAPPPRPTLVDEHTLAEGGVTLRAGLERAAIVGDPNGIVVEVGDHTGPLGGAGIDVMLEGPGSHKVTLVPAMVEIGRFRAAYNFGTAGKQKIRATMRLPGKSALVLVFDVQVQAGEKQHRHGNHDSEDMPVTVIGGEGPKLAGAPKSPVTPIPATKTEREPAMPTTRIEPSMPTTRIDPPPPRQPDPPVRTVIETPRPVSPPSAPTPPPAPVEEPIRPPPRPVDPTSLPPPDPSGN